MNTHSKFKWDQRSAKYHSVIMAGPWKVPFSYYGMSMESTIQLPWQVHGKYHSVIMAGPWKVPFSYHGRSMELALPKLKPRREVAELVMVRSVQGVMGAIPSPYIFSYATIYI